MLDRKCSFLSLRALLFVALLTLLPAAAAASEKSAAGAALAGDPTGSTGDAGHRVAIAVPKGTGGFQPSLELQYSSSDGDGPFGVGWSLNLGEVRRSLRFGTPTYSASDRFELDGQILIDDSSSGEYRMEAETFARIEHDQSSGDQWIVTLPDGTILRYGTTQDTRIRQGGDTSPSDDTGPIFRWLLSEAEDSKGNVVLYDYDRTLDVGTGYPKSVRYTYRGAPGARQVVGFERRIDFYYEVRPDPVQGFAGAVEGHLGRRATEIRSTVGGNPYRRLILSYSDSASYSTHRSRLASVQLFGTDCPVGVDPAYCTGLPPQTFTYTDPADVLDPVESSQWVSTPWDIPEYMQPGAQLADVNGDGLDDIVVAYLNLESDGRRALIQTHKVYLNTGTGWAESTTYSAQLEGLRVPSYVIGGIFAGGRYCDRELVPFMDHVFFNGEFSYSDYSQLDVLPPVRGILTDVNADGRADIVVSFDVGEGYAEVSQVPGVGCTQAGTFQGSPVRAVFINDPVSGWISDPALAAQMPALYSIYFRSWNYVAGDFLDRVAMLNARENSETRMGETYTDLWQGHLWVSFLYIDDHGAQFGDLNGDRRPDLVLRREPVHGRTFESSAYLSTPTGWVSAPGFAPPAPLTADYLSAEYPMPAPFPPHHTYGWNTGARLVDVNGDGLDDFVKTGIENPHNPQTAAFTDGGVWLNTGDGWCGSAEGCVDAQKYLPPVGFNREVQDIDGDLDYWPHNNDLAFADLNGDDKLDLVQTLGTTQVPTAWIHAPAGTGTGSVWLEDARFKPPQDAATTAYVLWPYTLQLFSGVRIGDIDGNGTPDFAKLAGDPTDALLSQSTFPDLVAGIDNGRGGLSSFEYASSIAQRDAALEADAAADASDLGETGPGFAPAWAANPVVSQMTVEDVDENAFTASFAYAGPSWDPTRKMGLGYRLVEATRDDGSISRTYYWQEFGRTGRESQRVVSQGTEDLLVRETDWELVDVVDTGGPGTPSVGGSVAGARVARVTSTTTSNLYGGDAGATRTVGFSYDDTHGFNFASQVVVTRPTGAATTTRVPAGADLVNWIAGKVASETVTGNGLDLRSREFTYEPGTGLLTQLVEEVEPIGGGGTPDEAITSWVYDDYRNLIQETDPEGRTIHYCYDGDSALGPDGCPAFGLATHTVLTGIRDPIGGITTTINDLATGELRYLIQHNGDRLWLTTDAFGRATETTVQPVSHGSGTLIETRSYYDGVANDAGRPFVEREREVGDGSTIRSASYFDGLGRVSKTVSQVPGGWVGRTLERDYAGRAVFESFDFACAGGAPPAGDPHCLASGPTDGTTISYDALGRVLTRQSPLGLEALAYGRTVEAQPVPPAVTDNTFDFVVAKDRGGHVTRRLLDGGRVAWVDECSNTVAPGTSNPNDLVCDTPDRTFYTYHPTGELTAIYDATEDYTGTNHRLAYAYDTLGRVLEIDDPDGGTSSTTYDLVGNVETVTNARGQTTGYGYDALDRPFAITFDPGSGGDPYVTFTYDPHTRRRASMQQGPGVSTTYTYDDFGREARNVLSIWGPVFVTDFEYDLLGRITKIVYPSPNADVTYEYDGAHLTGVCGRGDGDCAANPDDYFISNVTYDSLGRPTDVAKQPGHHEYTYDPTTRRLTNSHLSNDLGEDLLDLSYSYDPTGNIQTIVDQHTGVGTDNLDASASYVYDHRNRLIERTIGGVSRYFQYDALGNLTGRDLLGPTDPANQLYDPQRPHALTQRADGASYAYDADGNVIQRGSQHLQYDRRNLLTCVGSAAGTCDIAQYAYDGDGNRIAETGTGGGIRILVNGLFEWDTGSNTAEAHVYAFGRRIATEVSTNASLRSAWAPISWPLPFGPRPFFWGLGVLAAAALLAWLTQAGAIALIRTRPASAATAIVLAFAIATPAYAGGGGNSDWIRRWYHHDHLGSAVLVTNEVGDAIHRRVFEPFGKLIAQTPSPTEPTDRLFTGKEFESLSGLYDFGARWYDAEAGRFLSIDPVIQWVGDPQTHNPYTYVRNNPVSFTDSTGMWITFRGPVITIPLSIEIEIMLEQATGYKLPGGGPVALPASQQAALRRDGVGEAGTGGGDGGGGGDDKDGGEPPGGDDDPSPGALPGESPDDWALAAGAGLVIAPEAGVAAAGAGLAILIIWVWSQNSDEVGPTYPYDPLAGTETKVGQPRSLAEEAGPHPGSPTSPQAPGEGPPPKGWKAKLRFFVGKLMEYFD